MSAKRRRVAGDGSTYLRGRIWWISYKGPDGRRIQESSHSTRKGDAVRLLRKRNDSREHNLPIITNAEQLTFYQAT
jgi:hypothetical protein